jgi:hypothetical protein
LFFSFHAFSKSNKPCRKRRMARVPEGLSEKNRFAQRQQREKIAGCAFELHDVFPYTYLFRSRLPRLFGVVRKIRSVRQRCGVSSQYGRSMLSAPDPAQVPVLRDMRGMSFKSQKSFQAQCGSAPCLNV